MSSVLIFRYIAIQVFIGLVIATAILLPLFSFFDLLEQIDDVGKGTYKTLDAFMYTTMLLPRRFIQIAPFIALLGTVASLGMLAVNSELVAMRSAGLSPLQISFAPLAVGIALVLLTAGLEQFVAPQLQQKAISNRAAALNQTAELGTGLGIWTRNEKNILRIGRMLHAQKAADIEIMYFGKADALQAHIHAEFADVRSNDAWILSNVVIRKFTDSQIQLTRSKTVRWKSFLNPEDIATLTKPPESLSPVELVRHVDFLNNTGQDADSYTLALWRKAGSALLTIAMLLLSIPLIFGSIRSGLANKLVLATLIGVAVYLIDQIFANAGLVLHLDPALAALAPSIVLILLAILWLQRVF